ncbi:unnamed protein product [Oppiella nova]|uniref:Transposase n=1 Tax=Oppiella nova TaxID=334625 RepID=A0A7R9M830_9ACAR|nr:unnamed protein product [Oppiella nova]CAG2172378.1 unnamed protein product [Oppiella nova]
MNKEDEDKTAISSKKHPKRQKLPDNLERTEIMLTPDSIMSYMWNNDISETLEYIPSSFKVIRHTRPRCVCINCETIVQAYPPSGAIDKGKAGSGLLAHILVQKYCNHLPLYRQSQIYEREENPVFSASQIHADDTPVKVLAPGIGKTKIGRIWTYVRDGRHYGDNTPLRFAIFIVLIARESDHLTIYKTLQEYYMLMLISGYDQIYRSDDNSVARIIEAACWAHTRRKFYGVTVNNDKANIAFKSLEQIALVYRIEEKIRGLNPDERRKQRQERFKEIIQKLFADWKKFYHALPKKSYAYALNNEAALMRFLDNGRIEIDNNAAERAMRLIAVGRKNWLFAGSDGGGETAAAIYSLIETAKLNNINPWTYLQKVLSIIQDYNSAKISDLLPWNLKLG